MPRAGTALPWLFEEATCAIKLLGVPCGRKVCLEGMCTWHYAYKQRNPEPRSIDDERYELPPDEHRCTVADLSGERCINRMYINTMCAAHNQRLIDSKSIGGVRISGEGGRRRCVVVASGERCQGYAAYRGVCIAHYARRKRGGTFELIRPLPAWVRVRRRA